MSKSVQIFVLKLVLASCTCAYAQTRADSTAIARLIVSQALRDAQRHGRDIRALTFAPTSAFYNEEKSAKGARLLQLGLGPFLKRETGTPICPWMRYGRQQSSLELIVTEARVSETRATAEITLTCRPSVVEADRGGFMWTFTYKLQRDRQSWIIARVIERWIT